jgi:stearoyl-CoA desaturase (delta-9 desaturase)
MLQNIPNWRYLFSILLPLHLAIIFLPFYTSWEIINIVYFLIGYVLIHGLGINVGLHRWASHRAVDLKEFAKPIVVYLSILGCQGQLLWWAAVHRGYHHRKSDTIEDHHSPVHHGKWHAFIGWILKHDPSKVNFKYSADLAREKWIIQTHRYYEVIIWASWILVGLVSLNALFWMIIIPTFIALHFEGLVNAFCHGKSGYTNYATKDQSRNVPLLGYFGWGNGWHNNHHYAASSYDFGKGVSSKWWEFDPCVIFLPFIKK